MKEDSMADTLDKHTIETFPGMFIKHAWVDPDRDWDQFTFANDKLWLCQLTNGGTGGSFGKTKKAAVEEAVKISKRICEESGIPAVDPIENTFRVATVREAFPYMLTYNKKDG